MSYDEKCYELASYFLPRTGSESLREELAAHVQQSVEDWLESKIELVMMAEPRAQEEERANE